MFYFWISLLAESSHFGKSKENLIDGCTLEKQQSHIHVACNLTISDGTELTIITENYSSPIGSVELSPSDEPYIHVGFDIHNIKFVDGTLIAAQLFDKRSNQKDQSNLLDTEAFVYKEGYISPSPDLIPKFQKINKSSIEDCMSGSTNNVSATSNVSSSTHSRDAVNMSTATEAAVLNIDRLSTSDSPIHITNLSTSTVIGKTKPQTKIDTALIIDNINTSSGKQFTGSNTNTEIYEDSLNNLLPLAGEGSVSSTSTLKPKHIYGGSKAPVDQNVITKPMTNSNVEIKKKMGDRNTRKRQQYTKVVPQSVVQTNSKLNGSVILRGNVSDYDSQSKEYEITSTVATAVNTATQEVNTTVRQKPKTNKKFILAVDPSESNTEPQVKEAKLSRKQNKSIRSDTPIKSDIPKKSLKRFTANDGVADDLTKNMSDFDILDFYFKHKNYGIVYNIYGSKEFTSDQESNNVDDMVPNDPFKYYATERDTEYDKDQGTIWSQVTAKDGTWCSAPEEGFKSSNASHGFNIGMIEDSPILGGTFNVASDYETFQTLQNINDGCVVTYHVEYDTIYFTLDCIMSYFGTISTESYSNFNYMFFAWIEIDEWGTFDSPDSLLMGENILYQKFGQGSTARVVQTHSFPLARFAPLPRDINFRFRTLNLNPVLYWTYMKVHTFIAPITCPYYTFGVNPYDPFPNGECEDLKITIKDVPVVERPTIPDPTGDVDYSSIAPVAYHTRLVDRELILGDTVSYEEGMDESDDADGCTFEVLYDRKLYNDYIVVDKTSNVFNSSPAEMTDVIVLNYSCHGSVTYNEFMGEGEFSKDQNSYLGFWIENKAFIRNDVFIQWNLTYGNGITDEAFIQVYDGNTDKREWTQKGYIYIKPHKNLNSDITDPFEMALRVRYSSNAMNLPTGEALGGEVEDYKITIEGKDIPHLWNRPDGFLYGGEKLIDTTAPGDYCNAFESNVLMGYSGGDVVYRLGQFLTYDSDGVTVSGDDTNVSYGVVDNQYYMFTVSNTIQAVNLKGDLMNESTTVYVNAWMDYVTMNTLNDGTSIVEANWVIRNYPVELDYSELEVYTEGNYTYYSKEFIALSDAKIIEHDMGFDENVPYRQMTMRVMVTIAELDMQDGEGATAENLVDGECEDRLVPIIWRLQRPDDTRDLVVKV